MHININSNHEQKRLSGKFWHKDKGPVRAFRCSIAILTPERSTRLACVDQPRVHPHVQYLMWMDACCVPGLYHASHRAMMIPGRGSIPLRFLMESLSCTMRSWILISNGQSQVILQQNCAVLSALSPDRSLA